MGKDRKKRFKRKYMKINLKVLKENQLKIYKVIA